MIQLLSFHILVRFCSKSFKLGFCSTWTENFQIYKLGFENTVNQRSNCQCSLDHREIKGIPEKNIYFIDYAKTFDCVDHKNLWKIRKEMGIPDPLTCLLRDLYVGQDVTVRTGHGTKDWLKIGEGVPQACILSPCLFDFYAEFIMWNTSLDEFKAEIKIARRNINNLICADDTILMAKSEEKLKSLLMKVKEQSNKANVKLNIQKTKVIESDPFSSWQRAKQSKQWQILFSWASKWLRMGTAAMKKRHLLPW